MQKQSAPALRAPAPPFEPIMKRIDRYRPPAPADLLDLKKDLDATSQEMANLAGLAQGSQWRKYTGSGEPRQMTMQMHFYMASLMTLSQADIERVTAAMRTQGADLSLAPITLASGAPLGSDDEEEEAPIVENLKAPSDLVVGDYVFASRWSDCDPNDPWHVGHVSEVGPGYVVVGEVSMRRWPNAMRITHSQGDSIAKHYPLMEGGPVMPYQEIASVFGVKAQRK